MTDNTDSDGEEAPELPNGWEWQAGNRSPSHYTQWFGTKYRRGGDLTGVDGSIGGFDGEMYWDDGGGGDHHVEIYPVVGIRDDGDTDISEYPTISRTFDTEEEAEAAVPELIRELKERAQDDD